MVLEPYEALRFFAQIGVQAPAPSDEAWVWVAGVLLAGNIAQYGTLMWLIRWTLSRVRERDDAFLRRVEAEVRHDDAG